MFILHSGDERNTNTKEIIRMKELFQNYMLNISETNQNHQKLMNQFKIDIEVLDRMVHIKRLSSGIHCKIKNVEIDNSVVNLVCGKDQSEGNVFINGSEA